MWLTYSRFHGVCSLVFLPLQHCLCMLSTTCTLKHTLIRITSWINTLIRIIALDQLTHQDHRPGSTYSSGSSPWINLLIRIIVLDPLTHQDHRPGSTYSSGSSPWIHLLIRIIALDPLTHQDNRPGSTYSS